MVIRTGEEPPLTAFTQKGVPNAADLRGVNARAAKGAESHGIYAAIWVG